jgi:hypothetical protein
MRLAKSIILVLLFLVPSLLAAQTATVARYAVGKKLSVVQGTTANLLTFDTKVFDAGSYVPTGSSPSEFTAPKTGYYRVSVTVSAQASGGATFSSGYAYSLHLFKVGNDAGTIAAFYAGSQMTQGVASGELIVNLQQGQQVDIRMNTNKEGSDAAPVNFEIPGNPNNPSSWIDLEYLGQ